LETVLSRPQIFWLNVIGNWRKLLDVQLHKLYPPPDIFRINEEMMEFEWLGLVE